MIRPRLGYRLLFAYGLDMDPDIAASRVADPTFVTVALIPSGRFQINSDAVTGFVIHGII